MKEPLTSCVIYNSAAGRGRARRIVELAKSRVNHQVIPTSRPGEGELIARQAVADGFRRIVAAGGDGTVHEVANGILTADNPDVILAIWPVGSANDYAYALGLSSDLDQPLEVQQVDVGLIRSADGRSRYFVNGMGLGFNGEVTIEARKIRWLRGIPLYSLALFRAMLWRFDQPMMTVRFDQETRQAPTLALTLNLGKREGGFPLTSKADLCDGLFDYMHVGPVSRWELVRHFPQLVTGTLPGDHPKLWLGQCHRLEVESEVPLRVHLDGEFFCHPEEESRTVAVDLLPRRLRVERGATPASR